MCDDTPGRREAAVEMNRSRQLDDAQYIGESVHRSDRAMLEPRTRKLDARPFNFVSAVVILAPCLKATKRGRSDCRNEVQAWRGDFAIRCGTPALYVPAQEESGGFIGPFKPSRPLSRCRTIPFSGVNPCPQ
jgi:hypothetical protein